MARFIAAFALQQLQEMEALQRDLGRRRSQRRRAARRAERAARSASTTPRATTAAVDPQQLPAPG